MTAGWSPNLQVSGEPHSGQPSAQSVAEHCRVYGTGTMESRKDWSRAVTEKLRLRRAVAMIPFHWQIPVSCQRLRAEDLQHLQFKSDKSRYWVPGYHTQSKQHLICIQANINTHKKKTILCLVCVLETEFYHVALAGLEVTEILLTLHVNFWDQRHLPPGPDKYIF